MIYHNGKVLDKIPELDTSSYLCISMIVLEVRILSYYFTILTISINFSCNQFFLVDLLGRCIHPGTGEANQQLAA